MQADSSVGLGREISSFAYYARNTHHHVADSKIDYSLSTTLGDFEDNEGIDEATLAKTHKYTMGFITDHTPIQVKLSTGNTVMVLGIVEIKEDWLEQRKFKDMIGYKGLVRLYKNDDDEIIKVSMHVRDLGGSGYHGSAYYYTGNKIAAVALCTFIRGNISPRYDTVYPNQVTDFTMVELKAPIIFSELSFIEDNQKIINTGYVLADHPSIGGIVLHPSIAKMKKNCLIA